ncbi:vacuolar membrane protein pep3 [Cryptosporidium canis]|uniref:Vacuolar membrane protein pep3 n=1 Tax=Cryptosporidium canis TaxID=195482 RepID=A0ABQ8P2Q3_9CRYT|nr:vacuolar membrane protein pep3 [Cryptosporidium canis]
MVPKLFTMLNNLSNYAKDFDNFSSDEYKVNINVRYLLLIKLVEHLKVKRILSPRFGESPTGLCLPTFSGLLNQLHRDFPYLRSGKLPSGVNLATISTLSVDDPLFELSLRKVSALEENPQEVSDESNSHPRLYKECNKHGELSEFPKEDNCTQAPSSIARLFVLFGVESMREEEFYDKREESITVQPRLYSFDSSWDTAIHKLKQTDSIKSPVIVDQVVRSGGLFYVSLITGQLLRWFPDEVSTDLIVLEPPVGLGSVGSSFEGSEKERFPQTPQIFVDQMGDHALFVHGTGEAWYLHSTQVKARFIQKLSSYSILSVAWNNWEASRNSAVSVIIGCKSGTILTTILGPDISSSSTVIRVLHEISATPILSVMLDSIRIEEPVDEESGQNDGSLNRCQYVVSVSTPTKLLLWHGQNRIIDLFLRNDGSGESSRYCLEIGSIDVPTLTSKIRLLEVTNYHFLVWISSRDIFIYYINRSNHAILEADDYIGKLRKYDFGSKSTKIPNSVECSRYHIVALFEDYIDVISPITARSIYKVSIVSIPGQLVVGGEVVQDLQSSGDGGGISTIKSLAVEISSNLNNFRMLKDEVNREELEILDRISFIWGYNNDNIYKINIINEGGALWREWLYIGIKLQFIDLVRRGKAVQAAQLLSTIDDELSFNEICNMFIHTACWRGLIVYLTSKLQQLRSNHKDPITTNTAYQDETVILKFVVLNLRKDWHVLVQEYICFGIIDQGLVKRCFEIFVSIGSNVSKRDKLLIQYSPIMAYLDPKRYLSLLKRPSFSSIDMSLILPYLLELSTARSGSGTGDDDALVSKEEREELDKLAILVIENFLNMNGRQRNQLEMERVSTRVKLMIHTETWKGNKTIWNVLAILCSKLEEGEELLLSYITPLISKAKKESLFYDEGQSETKLEMEFDLPFLLDICNKRQYKKLKAYVYCLLGFYDSAMAVCLKELNSTKLTKDIIYNFIESYDQRRKWILNLIRPLGYNRDIQGLTKLLAASPKYILTLSDVLMVIPDDIQLSFLSNVISSNIGQFDDLLLKRTKIYDNYKQSRDNLLTDLFSCHTSYNVVDPQNDFCFVCYRNLFNYQGFNFEDVREFAHSLRINHLDQVQFSSLINYFLSKSGNENINQRNTRTESSQVPETKESNPLGLDESHSYKFLNEDLNSNILVFPCSHSFHFGCMLLKYASLMNHDETSKLTRIIEGICKHSVIYFKSNGVRAQPKSDSNSKTSQSVSRSILEYQQSKQNRPKKRMDLVTICDKPSNSILPSLYKQLISLVNNDCLICGELMIRNIDKPFITEDSQNNDLYNFYI